MSMCFNAKPPKQKYNYKVRNEYFTICVFLLFFKTATLLSAYLWLRLTPARVMVSVAYEPWNTDIRDLEEFNIELKKWGADTKLGEATFYLFSSVRIQSHFSF